VYGCPSKLMDASVDGAKRCMFFTFGFSARACLNVWAKLLDILVSIKATLMGSDAMSPPLFEKSESTITTSSVWAREVVKVSEKRSKKLSTTFWLKMFFICDFSLGFSNDL